MQIIDRRRDTGGKSLANRQRFTRRAGFRASGPPSALSIPRTMRKSLSRRIALGRPRKEEIKRLQARLRELEDSGADPDAIAVVRAELERQERRARIIPYIDPFDL